MTRMLAVLIAFCALFTTPSIASAAAPEQSVGALAELSFYCAGADTETVCDPAPIYTIGYVDIYVRIDNHAAGGERCRLFINGRGHTPWVYINAGDGGRKYLAQNVPDNTGFNVRCQRRAAAGDAGIGGWVGVTPG
ncbi:hypothetical protein FKR81_29200 [Lentzea tibetensis]|uniref:Peptidase inhibitor family I36 n=1 Tax=Lentzea tibetensis TaxID=2591470 RepID=A0A563ENX3_9PSEU|nr:hypothetical protein [Lentzea tibetensis]TWP48365.1 hypothetical protein FKR81_29200 [Lentzea tibetensis]